MLYLTEKEKERAVEEVHSLQEKLNQLKKREAEVEDQVSLLRIQDEVSCDVSVQSSEDESGELSSQASRCKSSSCSNGI